MLSRTKPRRIQQKHPNQGVVRFARVLISRQGFFVSSLRRASLWGHASLWAYASLGGDIYKGKIPGAYYTHSNSISPAPRSMSSPDFSSEGYRLPENVRPTHYDLTIKTDLLKLAFESTIIIEWVSFCIIVAFVDGLKPLKSGCSWRQRVASAEFFGPEFAWRACLHRCLQGRLAKGFKHRV